MEKKKKVYIRGCKGCGDEVKNILKEHGAKYPTILFCDNDAFIYFINHDGEIDCTIIGSEEAHIIMDNYKEIKLPQRQWKDGDILIHSNHPHVYAVFKKYKDKDTFEAYFALSKDELAFFDTLEPVGYFHLASAKERRKIPKLFYVLLNNLEALHKCLSKKEREE